MAETTTFLGFEKIWWKQTMCKRINRKKMMIAHSVAHLSDVIDRFLLDGIMLCIRKHWVKVGEKQ